MKTKILSGLICCLGILSANAQTITAPVGQSLTITNAVDVTGGGLNILTDSEFKIGGKKVLSNKGTDNVFIGEGTGLSNTGTSNTFIGKEAGLVNTTGYINLFLGTSAGVSNSSGSANTFIGAGAGRFNTVGGNNLYIGTNAGSANAIGNASTFIGLNSGANSTSDFNSFLGAASAEVLTSGVNNAGIGVYAGKNLTTGYNNTFIGFSSGVAVGSSGISNSTSIGANAAATLSNTVVLGQAATTITGQGLAAGASGLRFANLNSSSATVASGGSPKVLSVDGSGNVVLVALAGGATTTATNPIAESTWKNADGYLYNNSTNGVVINGAGLDGNALIVKGGVLSKEVNVKVEGAESWPDYVFKPSYKRMSLEEVDKFIAINGHLPNVPSATEMASTGNNLNKTDIKLLEKVEELTLYLLEMKKANDAQSAEIQSLKKQMSKLRKK
ncbi:hypothetical protein LV89_03716 [Arcicella aurantiaca]|uniref:Trimeric autotransporter adhesin n=1 Tax=Arcicella aurantiaca TaxID=591202 RepID=A0A316DY19_9BACT|nr:bZIP transcription factor [Arcicella aurantiaca]PWK21423.1 hypothetical protein LV89_03716 [Arcicella aurantiaca]